MSTIGIAELREHAEDIVRRVSTTGETIEIVIHGQIVAHLAPSAPAQPHAPTNSEAVDDELIAKHAAIWTELDRLGREIGETWPEGVSAVDAIRAQRRY